MVIGEALTFEEVLERFKEAEKVKANKVDKKKRGESTDPNGNRGSLPTITSRKDRTKENEQALVEGDERQQEEVRGEECLPRKVGEEINSMAVKNKPKKVY